MATKGSPSTPLPAGTAGPVLPGAPAVIGQEGMFGGSGLPMAQQSYIPTAADLVNAQLGPQQGDKFAPLLNPFSVRSYLGDLANQIHQSQTAGNNFLQGMYGNAENFIKGLNLPPSIASIYASALPQMAQAAGAQSSAHAGAALAQPLLDMFQNRLNQIGNSVITQWMYGGGTGGTGGINVPPAPGAQQQPQQQQTP